VNIALLVLGCVLEGTTIILVILPVFIPTTNALGIDLVHFGVMSVANIMLGLVTPPYGLLLFSHDQDRRRATTVHRPRCVAFPLYDDRAAALPSVQFRRRDHQLGSTRRSTSQADIIINLTAFTFTSIAILAAPKMSSGPIIELHISNIHRREAC